MTINLTREDFEQAIKSGASVFEGNTILDTGKPSGRYYRFIRMALAENSALNDCVPREKLRAYPQQWLPMATNS